MFFREMGKKQRTRRKPFLTQQESEEFYSGSIMISGAFLGFLRCKASTTLLVLGNILSFWRPNGAALVSSSWLQTCTILMCEPNQEQFCHIRNYFVLEDYGTVCFRIGPHYMLRKRFPLKCLWIVKRSLHPNVVLL